MLPLQKCQNFLNEHTTIFKLQAYGGVPILFSPTMAGNPIKHLSEKYNQNGSLLTINQNSEFIVLANVDQMNAIAGGLCS